MTEFVGIDQFVQLSAHSLEQLSKGVLGAINCNDAIATFVTRRLAHPNVQKSPPSSGNVTESRSHSNPGTESWRSPHDWVSQ